MIQSNAKVLRDRLTACGLRKSAGFHLSMLVLLGSVAGCASDSTRLQSPEYSVVWDDYLEPGIIIYLFDLTMNDEFVNKKVIEYDRDWARIAYSLRIANNTKKDIFLLDVSNFFGTDVLYELRSEGEVIGKGLSAKDRNFGWMGGCLTESGPYEFLKYVPKYYDTHESTARISGSFGLLIPKNVDSCELILKVPLKYYVLGYTLPRLVWTQTTIKMARKPPGH